jgi:hypothetical protein
VRPHAHAGGGGCRRRPQARHARAVARAQRRAAAARATRTARLPRPACAGADAAWWVLARQGKSCRTTHNISRQKCRHRRGASAAAARVRGDRREAQQAVELASSGLTVSSMRTHHARMHADVTRVMIVVSTRMCAEEVATRCNIRTATSFFNTRVSHAEHIAHFRRASLCATSASRALPALPAVQQYFAAPFYSSVALGNPRHVSITHACDHG